MCVGGKRVKKKRKKKRMKTACRMERTKQERGFRRLLKRQKRVFEELAKWKKLKLKHKSHKRKNKFREIFSGYHLAFIWNSKLVLELTKRNLRGCCKRNGYVIVYWSYKLMHLKGIVKLNCELLLAAGARRRAQSKLKCVVSEKLLSFVKKEWAKVLDWKKHKEKYKHKESDGKNPTEMMTDTCSWLHRWGLLKFTQRKRKKNHSSIMDYGELQGIVITVGIKHKIRMKKRRGRVKKPWRDPRVRKKGMERISKTAGVKCTHKKAQAVAAEKHSTEEEKVQCDSAQRSPKQKHGVSFERL